MCKGVQNNGAGNALQEPEKVIIGPCLLNFMFLGQMGGSDRVGQ